MIEDWKESLTEFEKEVFNRVYRDFKRSGDWPNTLILAVELRRKGDLYRIGKDFGYSFIRVDHPDNKDAECKLTVFGIALCDGSEGDIRNFMNSLSLAIRKYIEDPVEAKLTSEDIKEEYSLSDQELSQVCEIILNTHFIWGGASHDKKKISYSFNLRHEILNYEGIESFEKLLEKLIESKQFAIPPRFGGEEKSPFPPKQFIWEEGDYDSLLTEKEIREIETGYVFILMPMSDNYELKQVNNKIREVCKKFGLKAERVDDIQSSGNITDEILSCINKAEIIVTDLTKEKPNVYYELGYAHGMGIGPYELILLAKEGSKLHFDIRNHRVIYYKDPDDMKEKLQRRFQALFDIREQI